VRKLQVRATCQSVDENLRNASLKTFISFGGGLLFTCHHVKKQKARTLQLIT